MSEEQQMMREQIGVRLASEMSYQTPVNQLGGSTIVLLTNPGEITHEFELYLRGVREKEDGTFVRIGRQPMSEEWAKSITMHLKSLVNQINHLGKTDQAEKERIIRFNLNKWAEILTCHWKTLGMNPDPEQRTVDQLLIATSMTNLFMVSLNRSLDGGDRSMIKGSTHEFTFNQPPGGEKKGLLGTMKSLVGMK